MIGAYPISGVPISSAAPALFIIEVPAIAVGATMPAVSWTREPVSTAGLQLIYRCELHSVTNGNTTIPMSSFQGYLREDSGSFVSATIPNGLAYIDDIEASTDDGYLRIYRGYRWPDGTTEQLELIAEAEPPLLVRVDQGGTSNSVGISGTNTLNNAAPQSRNLINPTYRNAYDGQRRYRCEIDNFLRPGDTAIINSESFTVGEINYIVDVTQANMEIAEAV